MSPLQCFHPTHSKEYAEFQVQNLSTLEVFGLFTWSEWLHASAASLQKIGEHVWHFVGRLGCGTRHFVAVFAVYHCRDGPKEHLIGLSPTEDAQTADAQTDLMQGVLAVYDETTAMIKLVVGDNFAANQSLATKLGVALAIHRLNLAMLTYLSDSDDLTSQIYCLMKTLRPNNAAQLTLHTHLQAERSNASRWSSVWKMVDKCICIRDAARHLAVVEELLPHGNAHRRIAAMYTKLKELHSVCEKLQHHKRTFVEVRALFDACAKKYPVLGTYLDAGAPVVRSPVFESAVIKIFSSLPLFSYELVMLEPFRRSSTPKTQGPAPNADFATEVLRQAKKTRRAQPTAADYIPLLGVVPPTINRCKRLFSECKYLLQPHRASIHSANFERLMFLKANRNRDLWNASTPASNIVNTALAAENGTDTDELIETRYDINAALDHAAACESAEVVAAGSDAFCHFYDLDGGDNSDKDEESAVTSAIESSLPIFP
ncbi:unnamed protein product [Phytophthora fragariaefolia]|uniref:Unnamed protein product n=1 Tax=Phytophthora fragariaefolia TaxID=1490495 RepID=A0A9W6XEW7_9STRA|nr:unnamed protein product [Phytophthora fragariaefolia]